MPVKKLISYATINGEIVKIAFTPITKDYTNVNYDVYYENKYHDEHEDIASKFSKHMVWEFAVKLSENAAFNETAEILKKISQ